VNFKGQVEAVAVQAFRCNTDRGEVTQTHKLQVVLIFQSSFNTNISEKLQVD
jgi:hypothetical protein